MRTVETDVVGKNFNDGKDGAVDNSKLVSINEKLRNHPVEVVGRELRKAMKAMKTIKTA